MRAFLLPLTLGVALLAGCGEEPSAPPPPEALTRDAIGYYCGMIVADHAGPKAQIVLSDREKPIWFTQVRDAVAFTMLPGESKEISAVYVSDMATASDWDSPKTWVPAKDAHYVIGSSRRGGMGAMETVPFSDRREAEAFVKEYGGKVVSWQDIPQDYVLGDATSQVPQSTPAPAGGTDQQGHNKEH